MLDAPCGRSARPARSRLRASSSSPRATRERERRQVLAGEERRDVGRREAQAIVVELHFLVTVVAAADGSRFATPFVDLDLAAATLGCGFTTQCGRNGLSDSAIGRGLRRGHRRDSTSIRSTSASSASFSSSRSTNIRTPSCTMRRARALPSILETTKPELTVWVADNLDGCARTTLELLESCLSDELQRRGNRRALEVHLKPRRARERAGTPLVSGECGTSA